MRAGESRRVAAIKRGCTDPGVRLRHISVAGPSGTTPDDLPDSKAPVSPDRPRVRPHSLYYIISNTLYIVL